MKSVLLKFSDVLKLIEFISVTGRFDADADIDYCCIAGRFSEADIELAIYGFEARTLEKAFAFTKEVPERTIRLSMRGKVEDPQCYQNY